MLTTPTLYPGTWADFNDEVRWWDKVDRDETKPHEVSSFAAHGQAIHSRLISNYVPYIFWHLHRLHFTC